MGDEINDIIKERGMPRPSQNAIIKDIVDPNPKVELLQDWVKNLNFMQQSVLLTGIRAPDTLSKSHPAKLLCRWYRRCILTCAFCRVVHSTAHEYCGGKFTGSILNVDEVAKNYLINVDEIPHHYHLHLVHGAQIIGYKHPIPDIKYWWFDFYMKAVNDMHLYPESEKQMDYRLADNELQWREHESFSTKE